MNAVSIPERTLLIAIRDHGPAARTVSDIVAAAQRAAQLCHEDPGFDGARAWASRARLLVGIAKRFPQCLPAIH